MLRICRDEVERSCVANYRFSQVIVDHQQRSAIKLGDCKVGLYLNRFVKRLNDVNATIELDVKRGRVGFLEDDTLTYESVSGALEAEAGGAGKEGPPCWIK